MESNGIIRGFSKYSAPQLEQMKKDLSLSLSYDAILLCGNYYRSLKRDPFIDELQMLDRYIEAQKQSISSFAPIQMMTNDDFVAQTYADMMSKRHTLSPNATCPCTLSEAFGIATAYLRYAGKRSQHTTFHSMLEKRVSRSHGSPPTVSADGTPYGLRLTNHSTSACAEGDLFLLLLPDAGLPHYKNGVVQNSLLGDEWCLSQIKGLTLVGECGLLRTLLELADGLWIDLTRLSRTGEVVPLTMIADGFVGYPIVRIDYAAYEAFYQKARTFGVSAMAFAQAVKGTTYTFRRGSFAAFSLESAFLQTLIPLQTGTATLENEADYLPAPISHLPRFENACKYLTKANGSVNQVQSVGNSIVAVASATPTRGFFRNALECALVPVLTLAASGCSYDDIRLAIALSLPAAAENATISSQLSTILGLYRLSAELGIPLSDHRIDTDTEQNKTHLSVYGIGNAAPTSAIFTKPDHFVHAITPVYLPNGLPDFVALRSLLQNLIVLKDTGILVGTRILVQKSLTDGLNEMSTDTIGCRITNFDALPYAEVPITLILETTKRIEAFMVGKTVNRIASRETEPSSAPLPQNSYLFANPKNRILLVTSAYDYEADLLETILSSRGAILTRLTAMDFDIGELCRTLMQSRTLILCGNIKLPKNPQIEFAIETFCRAGGWILRLGVAECDSSIPSITLPNGLDEDTLKQICENCNPL